MTSRPVAVEIGDQCLECFAAAHGAIKRGAVGELVTCLMHRRIAHAPELLGIGLLPIDQFYGA
jgi:hypothetical protein